jgi:hypothetical protein
MWLVPHGDKVEWKLAYSGKYLNFKRIVKL